MVPCFPIIYDDEGFQPVLEARTSKVVGIKVVAYAFSSGKVCKSTKQVMTIEIYKEDKSHKSEISSKV